jgi:ribosomal protein S18 acetylase RimI-like enzyme
MEIRSLENFPEAGLFEVFSQAFSDYERQWTRDEFTIMLKRNGYSPRLSFGAFDKERMLGFTLNAEGLVDGVKTVYDTGTGTLPEYRGNGVASRIMEHALPALQKASKQQYLLEVLQKNQAAITVYERLGFSVHREFNYFICPAGGLSHTGAVLPEPYLLKPVRGLRREIMRSFWDFVPSWQNNFDACSRCHTQAIGAFYGDRFIGYGIINPDTGEIMQLAVDRSHRNGGVGAAIFSRLAALNKHPHLKIINTDRGNIVMTHFLEDRGMQVSGTQYEMLKRL